MTRALALLARRAAQTRNALALKGGGGGPVPPSKPPTQALAEQDEVIWDDGSAFPQPALDDNTIVSKNKALLWLLTGLSSFVVVATALSKYDINSKRPWAPREFTVPREVTHGVSSPSSS